MFLVWKSGIPKPYFKLFVDKNGTFSFFYISHNTKSITKNPVDTLLVFSKYMIEKNFTM